MKHNLKEMLRDGMLFLTTIFIWSSSILARLTRHFFICLCIFFFTKFVGACFVLNSLRVFSFFFRNQFIELFCTLF